MAEEFILDWKLDQPAVLAGRSQDLYALVTIRLNIARLGPLLESTEATALPAHLIVMVDVSGSMQTIIRDDPNARIIGQGTSEGQSVRYVETSVPSRLMVAQQVVAQLVTRMEAADRMTLVAFDHQAYPLADSATATAGGQLASAVSQLTATGGGGTSMGRGFQAVLKTLARDNTISGTQKIIVLTDGEDQEPDLALEQARLVAERHHVPIHAFGTGECREDFLMDICKTTMGAFRHITNETEAEHYFDEVLGGQKNTLATRVSLQLWLSPEMFVGELYRTKPEVLYIGDVRPDSNNSVLIPIEYMEKGRSYEFLFRCTVPSREAGRRFRLAKATLAYDIPALSLTGAKAEANIVVEYTDNNERAEVRNGDVRRVIAQAEIQRQVLFLQGRIDLLNKGDGTEKDRVTAARLLDVLVKKYEEFNDQANVNHYRKMMDELEKKGTISQNMLNQSLAASSKVEAAPTVQEIDDF